MDEYFMISDAAREVKVEPHVLRYWEDELEMEVKRNEAGHRYYSREDIACLKRVKGMKDSGLGLKAIKVVLKEGKIDFLPPADTTTTEISPLGKEDEISLQQKSKGERMQYLLSQMIKEAVMEGNAKLIHEVKDAVIKELDYQFRQREEYDMEREKRIEQRTEEYYKKIDELLRKKSKRHSIF